MPEDFSEKGVKTVDMFRRKTYDLDCECLIYFDIETGDIVFCSFASGDKLNEVTGDIYSSLLKGMHIASVHNHPNRFFPPPSGKNFEMLGLEFEEYELILSEMELWILESKMVIFDDKEINRIREKANDYLDSCFDDLRMDLDEDYLILDNINKNYGDFLLYLFNKYDNIKLTRRFINV